MNDFDYLSWIKNELIFKKFTLSVIKTNTKVYRSRIGEFKNKSELWYPPKDMILKKGRVNNEKEQVFYSSISAELSLFELYPKENEIITLLECETNVDLQFQNIESLKPKNNNDIYHHIIDSFKRKIDNDEDYYKTIQIYKFLNDNNFSSGLIYPSAAMDFIGQNIAIKPNIADINLIPSRVFLVKIIKTNDSGLHEFVILKSALVHKNGSFEFTNKIESPNLFYSEQNKLMQLISKKYSDGIELYNQGQYENAIESFDNSLKILSKHENHLLPDVLLGKAGCLFRLGKIEEAEKIYDEILKLNSSNLYIAFEGLSKVYFENNLFNKSAIFAVKSLNANPNYSELYFILGNIEMKKGNFSRAIDFFNKAISLNSEESNYFNNRGISKASVGNIRSAYEDFEKSLLIFPENLEAKNNLLRAKSILRI